jgi:hypothetical protein
MTNIIRPIAGAVANYTSCGFTAADFNSLANASVAVMPTTANIDNTTNLDDYIDVSFSFANGATTTVATSFFALFLLPLNQDGTTYGDGATTGSTQPGVSYWVTNANTRSGITSGGTLVGTFPTVWLPRKRFILAIANMTGGALNASAAAAVQYNTTNLNGNG